MQRGVRILPRQRLAETKLPIGPARTRAANCGMHELRPEMQHVPAMGLNHVGLCVPLALRIPLVGIANNGSERFQIEMWRIVGRDGCRPWDDHSEVARG